MDCSSRALLGVPDFRQKVRVIVDARGGLGRLLKLAESDHHLAVNGPRAIDIAHAIAADGVQCFGLVGAKVNHSRTSTSAPRIGRELAQGLKRPSTPLGETVRPVYK
ncbi:MAG: hypothetical protein ACK5QX_05435 [bacterium]